MNKVKSNYGGTKAYICIIVLLVIALGAAYYFGFVKNNEKISELENKQIALEEALNKERATVKETENKETITGNSDVLDNTEVISLINELSEKAKRKGLIYELRVRNSSKESNDKYLITADYDKPIEITQKEYEKLVETGDCSNVLSLTGTYVKSNEQYGDGQGYGFVELYGEDHPGKSVYEIVKTDEGYAFTTIAGSGYPLSTSSKPIDFYLDGNSKIFVYNEGEKTLKEYADTLKEKLSGVSIPIVTVEYQNGAICLNESGK